jgi:hypothetical protein
MVDTVSIAAGPCVDLATKKKDSERHWPVPIGRHVIYCTCYPVRVRQIYITVDLDGMYVILATRQLLIIAGGHSRHMSISRTSICRCLYAVTPPCDPLVARDVQYIRPILGL